MRISLLGFVVSCTVAVGLLSGCGSGSSGVASSGSASGGVSPSGTGGSALAAEARSKATGDIPDSQVFLSYHNPQAGYSMQYPEGWAQRGGGGDVTFQEKNNIVHILVARGPAPTPTSAVAELARERQRQPSLSHGATSTLSIHGAPVLKVSYSTVSAPNPVTGKRVQLLVDRYVYAHAGKVAILDLGTATGVDNKDAYKMMSRSFRWR
jgi:hypothetical protein